LSKNRLPDSFKTR